MENQHLEALYPKNSREKELEQVITYIKEGKSCQVVSLPGVGRSNLLGLLSFNRNVRIKFFGEKQVNYHFVSINFSELRKRPLVDVLKLMFLVLTESLRERKKEEEYKKAYKLFKESVALNDELVIFQGLKKTIDALAKEKDLTIVFLFDRFEEYLPSLTSSFFTDLRILRNIVKFRFSCVFALNRPLEDVLEPEVFADYYEFVAENIVYLSLLDKSLLDFRISHLEQISGKKIDKDLLDQVLNLTGGHGKTTMLAIEAILAAQSDAPTAFDAASSNERLASSLELENFLLSKKTVKGSLLEIWYALTPEEQALLVDTSDGGRLNAREAMTPPRWTYLEKAGLVKNGKIQIPLFGKLLEELKKEPKSQEIAFDENRNIIARGNEILSDKFSSLEFKLMKFLLQNKERIIEREEIINAVWGDAVSTLGVTDQALDQLIFRLRKKIEENPNNPSHIQTIKGRGFKYTP